MRNYHIFWNCCIIIVILKLRFQICNIVFQQALTDKTHNPVAPFRVDYPIAHLSGNDLHLERNLFGVRTGNKSNITNIEYVEVGIFLKFREKKSTQFNAIIEKGLQFL